MDKLISADKLTLALCDDPNIPGREFAIVKRYIEEAEDEVVHGRWILQEDGYHCSNCDIQAIYTGVKLNYCPNCGAKMYGGTDNG